MSRPIDVITVPCALGAPDAGAASGPAALMHAGLLSALRGAGHDARWISAPAPPVVTDRWSGLARVCEDLARTVSASVTAKHLPLVVGGDHAIAVGTWRGVARAVSGVIGLLWFDAHLDAHTSWDSPSGSPHGMPLALLLGEGDPRLARACLSPCHVCVVGARDWEDEEMARLTRLGVRVFDDEEVASRGLDVVMAEALARVRVGTAGFGITFDLDLFDPAEAPGVSSPAPGGQAAANWVSCLGGLATQPDCLAIEIVECNSILDADGATAGLAVSLAEALFARKAGETRGLEASRPAPPPPPGS